MSGRGVSFRVGILGRSQLLHLKPVLATFTHLLRAGAMETQHPRVKGTGAALNKLCWAVVLHFTREWRHLPGLWPMWLALAERATVGVAHCPKRFTGNISLNLLR